MATAHNNVFLRLNCSDKDLINFELVFNVMVLLFGLRFKCKINFQEKKFIR